ncbi:hypothetical protein [Virgisporangium aurantiacum]|uniref:Uncharacterized protein n=1 Tax=Virgisporangium aurantiacum TaxID=175570 RepID=A0A8J3Z8N5_9ACTN|nr:hypothetical protein [Virgisporangium aurantiacum]GIJ59416.1 hypothetical protein Vau01_069320 [Virgisporangium aurantiacum]
MRAGQGFGRWGFIVGNVLIAFGAPVFVTSLIATVGAGRAGTPTRGEDIGAIAAGALFMIAGLIVTVTIGQVRPAPVVVEPAEPVSPPVRAADWPAASALEPLPLTFNTLDDYYTAPGGVAVADDEPYFPSAPQVPRPRNARAYCEPSVTVTRSTGSRRRPPAG